MCIYNAYIFIYVQLCIRRMYVSLFCWPKVGSSAAAQQMLDTSGLDQALGFGSEPTEQPEP